MDNTLSDEDLKFREEVRSFFARSEPDKAQQLMANPATYKEGAIQWQKQLFKQNWAAPFWPLEHGGAGWTITQAYLYESERVKADAPDVLPFGLKMVGPVIYTYGSEAQKARFLPGILNGDDWWCQGYSEPGAGSDLASLKTRAVREGDDYIVNGSKIWTTYAQHADWIFCLVRTDASGKPQNGISFLLIDMKSPGITVSPIHSINGLHSLNEVHFDNVRVPRENLIGEEGQGWTYAKSLLAHERTAIAKVADSKKRLDKLRALAASELQGGRPMIEDEAFRLRFTTIEIELMALEYMELRVLSALADNRSPGAESSLLKIKGTEIQQALHELAIELAGVYGGVTAGAGDTGHDFGNQARQDFMYGRAATIYGGSNEIQKNIIAKRVLGF
ncbi:pimeloyl-CoA dehydrogenase large subunit [Marinobacter salinexigens]|uniref:Pimeloyl-CoA dehydrogenase large subunit n=1 Tax=Marinobacter salinexigens TaxID=2919747 RepID=A0A5B0VCP1_9GAMM|nr:acyl-CoA dehydrogenase family protein [Marinobacter salinexigens]KAA1172337.1 pimeloyl-CoA dehydrogenase large subunit [Marinobacter salinexigens]